ncbi:MAG: hypothetical protein LC744_07990 [Chloroflexi bacterium]|nr:hypothetical protein [Chloroflexota bacterium]
MTPGQGDAVPPPDLPPHGPTELVEDERGELVERLSNGTATLLLLWLVGIGGLSTLLAAWLFVWVVSGERLGIGALRDLGRGHVGRGPLDRARSRRLLGPHTSYERSGSATSTSRP